MAFWHAPQPGSDSDPIVDLDYDATLTAAMPADATTEGLLVRAFAQEVHTAATLIAGVASAVNFAERENLSAPLLEARSLISGYSAQIENWPQRLLTEQLGHNTVQQVTDLYASFRRGHAALIDFEVDGSEIGVDRAALLHITHLTTIWRQSARRARMIIRALDETAKLPDDQTRSGEFLSQILGRIMDGEPAACRPDGTIVLPQLAERRRAPRRSLLQPAIVLTPTTRFTAFARDISAGGIGLMRMPYLERGTQVTIELESGRTFRGSIAWSSADEAGVTFERPLLPTDPLIFG